jgi:hypothetical protein
MEISSHWSWIANNSKKNIREAIRNNLDDFLNNLIIESGNKPETKKDLAKKVLHCLGKEKVADPKILNVFISILRVQNLDEFLKLYKKNKDINEFLAAALIAHMGSRPLNEKSLMPLIELFKDAVGAGKEALAAEWIHLFKSMGALNYTINNEGDTLLHFCCQRRALPLVSLLIEAGANIRAENKLGNTPLHTAILKGMPEDGIELLIDGGAPVNVQNQNGNTPLHTAINTKKSTAIIKLLINENTDLDIRNDNEDSPQHLIKALRPDIMIKNESDQYRECELAKTLANSWSLKDRPYLRGSFARIGQLKHFELLKKFKENLSNFTEIQELSDLIEQGFEASELSSTEIQKKYKKGKIIIFNTGWKKHTIQVIFYKDYLIICNRGQGAQKTSIKIYKIDRKNHPLPENDISLLKAQAKNFTAKDGIKYSYETLPKSLGYTPSLEDEVTKFINQVCVQSYQKGPSCWLTSAKTGVYALAVLEALTTHDLQSFASEKKRLTAFKKSFKAANFIYKFYSEFTKIEILKQYLDRPVDEAERDHGIVKEIHTKYCKKKWKYTFGDSRKLKKGLSSLNRIKKDKEIPRLHSRDEMKRLFQQYKENYELNNNFRRSTFGI